MAAAIARAGTWQLMNAASHAPSTSPCVVSESDDALILAAAGGDRNAFGRLIDRHSGRAFAVTYRMVGNRTDAEDVVQDAFIRAWRHAGRWQPGRAAFSTWLYRVVVNLAIDLKRRPRNDALDDVAEPVDETPDAEAELARQQQVQAVAAASATLPDRQRQAIALCFGAGLSNKAAADIIGVSVKALESLLIRAKRSLREAVAAQGWQPGD
jgi:RNA polymerase sigma-70 factor (ECF subfamily)